MGWGSGSRLASDLIDAAEKTISDTTDRADFYHLMVELFQDFDCDTLDECIGIDPIFDQVWKELYPSDDTEDWDEGWG